MNKHLYRLGGVLLLALNAYATEFVFKGTDAATASVSPGSVVVGGTATATTYTVSGVDLDGDSTNDSFTVTINAAGSSAITFTDRYLIGGNALTPGETFTVSYGGISGTLSSGSVVQANSFTFDSLKMIGWQPSNNEAYTITQSGVTSAVQTANRYTELSTNNFTVNAYDNGGATAFNPDYFAFTVDVLDYSPPLPPTTANGRNLIWIITDEHNLRTLGCYRDTMSSEMAEMWGEGFVVETPLLDSMADNGVLFTRMHASRAVCTPSRAAMFTGQYPLSLGIPNNSNTVGDGKYLRANVTTIFDVLKDAGYLTGYVGKWHLSEGGKPFENTPWGKWWEPYPEDDTNDTYGILVNKFMFNGGHDKWYGIVEDGLPATANGTTDPTSNGDPYLVNRNLISPTGAYDAWGQPLYSDGNTTNVKFSTDWLTDRTIDFINEFKSGAYNTIGTTYTSFFHVLSIPDPHTTDSSRPPYSTMYTNMTFELPRTWLNPNYNSADPYTPYLDNPSWMSADGTAADLYDPLDTGVYTIQDRIAQYFGMVKCIDDNVGRLIAHLENVGILQDTVLMFSSDHGDMFGEHRRVNKDTPHDMSMRIPCIVVDGSQLLTTVTNMAPLIPRGIIVEESGNNTDWLETFLSLLDVNNIPDTHGRDLTPLLDPSTAAGWHDVSVQSQGWMAATDSRYKLVLDAASDNATWLFDLERDPKEFTNYVDHADYEGVVRKLAHGIRDYMAVHPEDVDPDRITECNRLLSGWDRYEEVYALTEGQAGDDDKDGLSNVYEYTFGTDPLDPNNTNETPVIQINPINGWVTLSHQIRSPKDSTIPYTVEWRTNLVSGVSWSGTWDSVATNYPAASIGFERIEHTVELDRDELFFRLKANP
ncbi:sulfatase-like hydrolase/transferase [Pontiella sulfatireligans]|uniref:Arylsulfatase n=1 Tax=Pontiella sulfatireligans TaxID=2750658 RepID=A0A6C2UJL6_9BACT|nr:sulfatase-like hydrolase/transferase [Pontiella sulfatireligans]SPS74412.1 sulfatase S1_30 [Kiritimatiellales bacterium]VGO20422.1 Arylsulfatase [Pontiella sulfatireligans]